MPGLMTKVFRPCAVCGRAFLMARGQQRVTCSDECRATRRAQLKHDRYLSMSPDDLKAQRAACDLARKDDPRRREYLASWRATNAERLKVYARQYAKQKPPKKKRKVKKPRVCHYCVCKVCGRGFAYTCRGMENVTVPVACPEHRRDYKRELKLRTIRAWFKRFGHTYQERVRKRGVAPVERFDRAEIFQRDGYFCGICGLPTDPAADPMAPCAPSLDHIVPISLGGGHTKANTQCAHRLCNIRKGNRVAV